MGDYYYPTWVGRGTSIDVVVWYYLQGICREYTGPLNRRAVIFGIVTCQNVLLPVRGIIVTTMQCISYNTAYPIESLLTLFSFPRLTVPEIGALALKPFGLALHD